MRTLALYKADVGDIVRLKFKNIEKVITYMVILVRYTGSGKVQDAIFHPDELESGAGAGFTVATAMGYDLVLKAHIGSKEDGHIDARLTIDGKKAYDDAVALPLDEGPVVTREWSIFL